MRDILFKAKRIDNGEWVEGFVSYPHSTDTEKGVESYYFMEVDERGWYSQCVVSANTICQYPGLTDKNGNKIWENDILSIAKSVDVVSGNYFYPPISYPANVKVKWDLCAWMWETISKNKYYIGFPDAWCHYEAEVIGNIFDNPELLEGGAS